MSVPFWTALTSFQFIHRCAWIIVINCYLLSVVAAAGGVLREHDGNLEEFRERVLRVEFSAARSHAAQYLSQRQALAKIYTQTADPLLQEAFREEEVNSLLKGDVLFDKEENRPQIEARVKGEPCFPVANADHWRMCCSSISRYRTDDHKPYPAPSLFEGSLSNEENYSCRNTTHPTACCHFGMGNNNYQFLPLLEELHITLDIGTLLPLQQDGFLRPYDVSTVLWPAGYLLALCMAHLRTTCGIPAEPSKVLELGAGIGAPSAVLAMKNKDNHALLVVAADSQRQALALANSNARQRTVTPVLMDHTNSTRVQQVRNQFGMFDMVMGASLTKPFVLSSSSVMHALVAPGGYAVFAQSIGEAENAVVAPSLFHLHHRVSSDEFGMVNKHTKDAEFEIVVFQRDSRHPADEL